jgi:putative copper resistance protein D
VTALFALTRALHFASLMTVFGASALLHQARGIMAPSASLRRALFAASLVALATALLWLGFTAAQMSGGGSPAIADILGVVTRSTFGHVFLARLALLACLCVLCLAGSAAARTVIASAALVLLAVTSHAAAAAAHPPLGMITDGLHLLTAGFWVGGLVVLVPEVLARPRDAERLIALLKLFSRWGVVSVAVLVASGTLNGVFVLDMEMSWNVAYVTWLAVKIALAAVMVAIALSNKFSVLPGLERGDREAADTIPITVIAELACAMVVLLIAGYLGTTAPMAM